MADTAPAQQPPAQPAAPASPAPAAQPAAPVAQAPAAAPPAAAQAAPAVPPALAAMLGGAAQPEAPKAPEAAPVAPKPVEAPKPDESVAALRAQINATAIRDAVKTVAVEAGAISPDQVVKLFGDDLDVDASGRVFVKSDPRADVKRHLAQQLAANLHLLKPAVQGGGAGSPSTVQAPGAAAPTPPPHTREGGTAIVQRTIASMFNLPTAPAAQPAAQR